MRRAYCDGFREALAQWRMLLLAFILTLLGGLSFMAVSWVWLGLVLDASLATRTLATSLDAHVFVDLAMHHASSIRVFAGTIAVLAAAALLLWSWINAAIVIGVTTRESRPAAVFRDVGGRYRTFLALWGLTMAGNAVVIGLLYTAWQASKRWTEPGCHELVEFAVTAGCVVAGTSLVLAITTVHDHARVRLAETGDGAGRCFLWAWLFVLRRPRAILLALALMSTAAAIWLPYQGIATLVPVSSPQGLAISLTWAQCFMLARVFVRIWTFAATAALQSSAQEI